jgi:hypothetical protein
MEDCSERRDHAAVAELIHSGNRRSCRTAILRSGSGGTRATPTIHKTDE